MPKFFVSNNQIENENITIIGEDVNHIKNVLRMKIGENFNVCDTDTSKNYIAEIEEFFQDTIKCKIIKTLDSNVESNVKVHIFQGLPKADKMELIIQKSVELGVTQITPIEMKRCIVKLEGKDKSKKIERWQKIAEVAAKQCGRDIIPQITNVKNIKEISEDFDQYDCVLVCYENEKDVLLKQVLKQINNNSPELKIAVVIGPEGGIDISEVEFMKEKGAKVISLGERILRTETVALSILSIIMYEFEG